MTRDERRRMKRMPQLHKDNFSLQGVLPVQAMYPLVGVKVSGPP